VGTALVASGWILLGLGALKTWRAVRSASTNLGEERYSNKFALLLGTAVGLIALLAHSAVDFNLHIPANAILAVALIALLSSCWRFATERFGARLNLAGRLGLSAVILTGMVLLVQQAWRRGREYAWLERAALAPIYSPAQAACLQQAFAAEPKNPETAYALGEAFRFQSSEGDDNYRELAQQAMVWFDRSINLNPWNGYSYLRYGWSLDWLERFGESPAYFQRAAQLDPNGYFMAANIGLHYVQQRNFAAARSWFERSLRLEGKENAIARNYLQIVNNRLLEAATNEISAKLDSPRH
jgi:tetratricopeptide (TPR) repeat protein